MDPRVFDAAAIPTESLAVRFSLFLKGIAPNARELTAHPGLELLLFSLPGVRNPPLTWEGVRVRFDPLLDANTGRLDTPSYVSMAGAGPSITADSPTRSPSESVSFLVKGI